MASVPVARRVRVLAQHHLEARLGPVLAGADGQPRRVADDREPGEAGGQLVAQPGRQQPVDLDPAGQLLGQVDPDRVGDADPERQLEHERRVGPVHRPHRRGGRPGPPLGAEVGQQPGAEQGPHRGLLQQARGLPGMHRDQGVAVGPAGGPPDVRAGQLVAGQQLGRARPEGGVLGHHRAVGPEPVQRERRPQLGGVAAHLAGGHGQAALGRRVQGVPGGQGLLGPEERRRPGPVLRAVGAGQEQRDVAGRGGHGGDELAQPGPAPLGEGELPAEQGGQGDVVEGGGRPAGPGQGGRQLVGVLAGGER